MESIQKTPGWRMSDEEEHRDGGLALQESKPELKKPPLFISTSNAILAPGLTPSIRAGSATLNNMVMAGMPSRAMVHTGRTLFQLDPALPDELPK